MICPSNPFISIGPILAVPGVREALARSKAATVAVTPIIAGRAMKGPTADMLRDLGHEASAVGVAELYRDIVDLFVLDSRDADLKNRVEQLGLEVVTADTFMESLEDKKRLAGEVLASAAGRYPHG
jgi:LPPG:FO 2-phospho-L-lactate transferase